MEGWKVTLYFDLFRKKLQLVRLKFVNGYITDGLSVNIFSCIDTYLLIPNTFVQTRSSLGPAACTMLSL